jgi:hypothetical protein
LLTPKRSLDQSAAPDSPFLSEELFAREEGENSEPRAVALAVNSPFRTSLSPELGAPKVQESSFNAEETGESDPVQPAETELSSVDNEEGFDDTPDRHQFEDYDAEHHDESEAESVESDEGSEYVVEVEEEEGESVVEEWVEAEEIEEDTKEERAPAGRSGSSARLRKIYVFVAGVDYGFGRADFREFCKGRQSLIKTHNTAHDDLRFITFDVQSGKVYTADVTFAAGKSKTTTTWKKPFDPVTDASYHKPKARDHHRVFKAGQPGVMSIVDVYKAVREIGKSQPNTLFELSLFSHAYMRGPILVNSGGGRRRSSDDKDPRMYDFDPPAMSSRDLQLFQKAFHTGGIAWIWGCNFPREIHSFLVDMVRNANYHHTGVKDSTKLTFRLSDKEADSLSKTNPTIVPKGSAGKRIDISFGDVRRLVCALNRNTYAFKIATKAKVRTFAAPVGFSSDYNKAGMYVVELKDRKRFYENYMGVKFDPVHGYVEFPIPCPP